MSRKLTSTEQADPRVAAAVDTINSLGAYALAGYAECASPDSQTSPGAEFLIHVRDAVAEAIDYEPDTMLGDEPDYDGAVSQIADDAPSMLTHELWQQFTDLAAWQEDPTDFGYDYSDLGQGAAVCLYMIAERLAYALLELARDTIQWMPDLPVEPRTGGIMSRTEQADPRQAFQLVTSPGRHADGKVYVEIGWNGRRLSLTGVIGPYRSGNARGSWGQIVDALADVQPGKGWTQADVDHLGELWRRWHLNDVRAGCEHQRAAGWGKRPIDPDKPTDSYGRHFAGQQYDSWNLLGWVRPDEHPDGLLGRPCPTCGYHYGTAWQTEEVPTDVLEWLAQLPPVDSYPWAEL